MPDLTPVLQQVTWENHSAYFERFLPAAEEAFGIPAPRGTTLARALGADPRSACDDLIKVWLQSFGPQRPWASQFTFYHGNTYDRAYHYTGSPEFQSLEGNTFGLGFSDPWAPDCRLLTTLDRFYPGAAAYICRVVDAVTIDCLTPYDALANMVEYEIFRECTTQQQYREECGEDEDFEWPWPMTPEEWQQAKPRWAVDYRYDAREIRPVPLPACLAEPVDQLRRLIDEAAPLHAQLTVHQDGRIVRANQKWDHRCDPEYGNGADGWPLVPIPHPLARTGFDEYYEMAFTSGVSCSQVAFARCWTDATPHAEIVAGLRLTALALRQLDPLELLFSRLTAASERRHLFTWNTNTTTS